MEPIDLRLIEARDRAAVHAIFADGQAAPFMGSVPLPYEDEWFDKRIEAHESGRLNLFAMTSHNAEPLLGFIGYFFCDPVSKARADVVYCVHPKYWGRGIASQALSLLLGIMRANAIELAEAGAHFDNPASIRVLEKNGFNFEKEVMEYSVGRQEQVKTQLFLRAL